MTSPFFPILRKTWPPRFKAVPSHLLRVKHLAPGREFHMENNPRDGARLSPSESSSYGQWGFTGLVFRIFFHQAAVGGGSRLHGPGSHLHAVRLGLGPPGLRRHSYWSGERILPKLPLLGFWCEMGVYFILASSEDLMSIAVQKRAI